MIEIVLVTLGALVVLGALIAVFIPKRYDCRDWTDNRGFHP